MFDLVLSVCLLAQPALCDDRIVPVTVPTRMQCLHELDARKAAWIADHPGVAVAAATCVAADRLAASRSPFALVAVAPGVFVHPGRHARPAPDNRGDIANLGFVVGREAVAAIDAGGSRAVGEDLYAAIRQHTALPVRWLILTHMHPDHVLGASVFAEAGATIIGHGRLPAALINRAHSYDANFRRLIGERAYIGTRVIVPEPTDMPAEIDLGGRVLELTAHPTAHTDNDITVFDRATGTLFAGDLVFAEHTPAIDGSLLGWQSVLATLSERPAARVVPGHGPPAMPWPDGARALRDYLAVLTRETRDAVRRGDSMSTAIRQLGESQRGHWVLFDDFNPRNATVAYRELEWE